MKLTLQKIYPITDRRLSGLTHAEQVVRFIEGGARLVQIRDKELSSRELFDDVAAAVNFAHETGVRVLINDRVDVALISGADGVHLGQEDLPASAARRILGKSAIIGVSTHTVEQVNEALADGDSDYLAFGPVFATSTKSDHEPVVGLRSLGQVSKLTGAVPMVAIGGINRRNLATVLSSGADCAAMISEFYTPQTEIDIQFRELLGAARNV